MVKEKGDFKTEEELQEAILQEKVKGTPDIEIGHKYGVTYRYIERLITKSQGINISALKAKKKVKTLHPRDFKEEQTTVWSFRQRGKWATHSGEYRGNWSPYIPRNVILKYSQPGELVLDYFCGAGTTAVECKLLGRQCIAFDINDKAIELARQNIDFEIPTPGLISIDDQKTYQIYEPDLSVGDARDLSFIGDSSIDLICAHPPYADIIRYTYSKEGDLSFFGIDNFLEEMAKVASESFRVLKPGRQCAILIGDTRKKKHVIPLGFQLINVYLDAGFRLRELVIKRQHNCKTTGFWYSNSIKYNFLLLAHEYLPIFEKPKSPISLKETGVDYGLVVPTLERPPLKRKLDEFETTTVWVLPEKDFDKRLNKNVVDRYSNGGGYSTITFTLHSENETCSAENVAKKNKELIYIKLPFSKDNPSQSSINHYLKELNVIVELNLTHVNKGGFLVIQTQDVRVNGYIEPIANKVMETIKYDDLWLKEIVIVTRQEQRNEEQDRRDILKINHQYLLIYEKLGGIFEYEHS